MAGLEGTTLGSYVVEQRLGQGGFGEVYKAHHSRLDWQVCVKIIRPDRTDAEGFALFASLFEREAKVLAGLDHPNIVRLRDYNIRSEDDLAYLVMEYIEGGDLANLIRHAGGPLPVQQVDSIVAQIAAGLQYAHDRHFLHRDLKPQNILCHRDGRVVIADFGLAKAVETALAESSMARTSTSGTPSYMAPEHIKGKPEYRSDLYALGMMAYQMLAGRLPFQGDSTQIMFAQVMQAPPSLREFNPQVPPAVEQVVMKMLSKAPEERYQSALDFAQALHGAIYKGVSESNAVPQPVVPRSTQAGTLPPVFSTPSTVQSQSPPGMAPFPSREQHPYEPTRFSTPPPATPPVPPSALVQAGRQGEVYPRPPHPPVWQHPALWGSAVLAILLVIGGGLFLNRFHPAENAPAVVTPATQPASAAIATHVTQSTAPAGATPASQSNPAAGFGVLRLKVFESSGKLAEQPDINLFNVRDRYTIVTSCSNCPDNPHNFTVPAGTYFMTVSYKHIAFNLQTRIVVNEAQTSQQEINLRMGVLHLMVYESSGKLAEQPDINLFNVKDRYTIVTSCSNCADNPHDFQAPAGTYFMTVSYKHVAFTPPARIIVTEAQTTAHEINLRMGVVRLAVYESGSKLAEQPDINVFNVRDRYSIVVSCSNCADNPHDFDLPAGTYFVTIAYKQISFNPPNKIIVNEAKTTTQAINLTSS